MWVRPTTICAPAARSDSTSRRAAVLMSSKAMPEPGLDSVAVSGVSKPTMPTLMPFSTNSRLPVVLGSG